MIIVHGWVFYMYFDPRRFVGHLNECRIYTSDNDRSEITNICLFQNDKMTSDTKMKNNEENKRLKYIRRKETDHSCSVA